ncbi:putative inactive receptor-like protein kinase At3g56050 isoform X2 [Primulina tabacum]|uniref:putative inactive receptor-like protein kinase At3g56050 isoform X2 n=1 Tax=Primulina tabacum TaxID=48773 RepID=UPI003F59DD14
MHNIYIENSRWLNLFWSLINAMEGLRRSQSYLLAAIPMCFLFLLNSTFCWSLNDEGVALLKFKEKVVTDPYGALSNWRYEKGVETPCSWVGVGCSEGYVVVLNLKDLCLNGTLSPDIGYLVRVKFIILRNNSFSGAIPREIVDLKDLEVLDLSHNNISGQLPCGLGHNLCTGKLLLDNNELLDRTQNEIYKPEKLSKVQAEDRSSTTWILSRNSLLVSWNSRQMENMNWRKLLHESPKRRLEWFLPFPVPPPPPPEFVIISAPPPPVFSLSPPPIPVLNPVSPPSPLPHDKHVSPPSFYAPAERPSASNRTSREYRHQLLIVTSAIGGSLLLVIFITGILFCYCGKMTPVKPWATGITGQLQRAFVTGVPELKRSELEAACEDFSNVIGSSSVCTMYKGTLSNGVEIAVASIAVASAKEWTGSQEAQFRKKIDTLSKVNHKNFVNLLGYCMEDEPFTRMLVFEYAPNGTLFEHLHIKEAEHLDWAMRLRIAMGVAYCLEHMHQLTPALVHGNLTSSTVYLAEDYAAKLSDFIYQDDGSAVDYEPTTQNNVYIFGVLLFEMITGRLPHSVGGDLLQNWASDSLRVQDLREILDPTLRTYDEEQLQQIGDVIRLCTNPDPRGRPTMKEVCVMLREVTTVGPDEAVPKLSPLWWAELEIVS